ncbi:MAG: SDR family oxidoreductase [Synergistaceae bacterium]|nr:SDR family oxidoreductase [Synergistaceae bacterium]
MYSLVDLTDRKILVAGASRGIGRAAAVMFSRLGGKLILLARNEDGLKETLSMLEGEGHSYYPFDFSDTENISDLAKNINEASGAVDGIFYSVGITHDRPFMMVKPQDIQKVLNVNLCSFVELVRCFSKKKYFNPGLRVAVMSSTSSFVGKKAHLSYSVSKAGINEAVRCMATELAEKQIYVNAIIAGMIDTEMYRKYLQDSGGEEGISNKGLLRRQYLGIGKPEDIASVAAFLLSPAAQFITGTCIPVDGGYTAN